MDICPGIFHRHSFLEKLVFAECNVDHHIAAIYVHAHKFIIYCITMYIIILATHVLTISCIILDMHARNVNYV